jgi:hypothetical protein
MEHQQVYLKENLIETNEQLSPSGRYKVSRETFRGTSWNYIKETIYSCGTGEFIGEVKKNSLNFLNTRFVLSNTSFFQKGSKEYFISSKTLTCQIIIDCETGHVYENSDDKNTLCWQDLYQLSDNTLCVGGYHIGVPSVFEYFFYDMSCFSTLGLRKLDVKFPDGTPIPKYDYILMDNSEENYTKPVIKGDVITFVVNETRVCGIGMNRYRVDDIDMEVGEYMDQCDTSDGLSIPFWKSKTYSLVLAHMSFRREGDHVVMKEFWRDERQLEMDGDADEHVDRSERCDIIYQQLYKKFSEKYRIRVFESPQTPGKIWNIMMTPKHTRVHYYQFEFTDEKNSEIKIQYYHLRNPKQSKCIILWNENEIVDLI